MRKRLLSMAAEAVLVACALCGRVAPLAADETVRGRSIDTWLSVLRDRRSIERVLAIEALAEVGAKDPRIVPALAAVATDRECGWCAITALGGLGKDARQAAPVLIAIMSQGVDVPLRLTAAEALWRIDKDPRVVPALAALVTDRQHGRSAISSLGTLGEDARQAAPMLRAIMLQHPERGSRMVAAEALWQITKEPQCIDVLIQFLGDHDRANRAWAATVLGHIGPPAKKAIPKLLGLLGDHELWVRTTAVETLGQIHSEPRTAVPALVKALRDPTDSVRSAAARALASFGGDAANAIPALETATKDIDATLRVEAAYALWRIDKRQDSIRRLFSAVARPDDEGAPFTALERLGEIGRDDKDVAPRLVELVNRRHPLRTDIAMVLWDLGRRSEALATLSAELEDEQFANRRIAAQSLETLGRDAKRLGRDAKSVVPALLKALARTPDQEQMAPEPAVDDPPSIVQQNTPSEFAFFRLMAWMALQAIDPATASRFRAEHPESVPLPVTTIDPGILPPPPRGRAP